MLSRKLLFYLKRQTAQGIVSSPHRSFCRKGMNGAVFGPFARWHELITVSTELLRPDFLSEAFKRSESFLVQVTVRRHKATTAECRFASNCRGRTSGLLNNQVNGREVPVVR